MTVQITQQSSLRKLKTPELTVPKNSREVDLSNVNEAPVFVSRCVANPSAFVACPSIAEDTLPGSVVENRLVVSDVDSSEFTFTIVGGGLERFVMDPSTGQLVVAAGASFNFESGSSNTFVLDVQVEDADAGTNPVSAQVLITLTNVNEAPFFELSNYAFETKEGELGVEVNPSQPFAATVEFC